MAGVAGAAGSLAEGATAGLSGGGESGRAGSAGSGGALDGEEDWAAGASGGGGETSSLGNGGRSNPGAGGRDDDESWGGMDGLGGTRCWWPGVEEQDMGKIVYAYDLPADQAEVVACAQEQCDTTECGGPNTGWCPNCTRGHDACRCACLQLYRECGDCEAYDLCIGYCLVMHC